MVALAIRRTAWQSLNERDQTLLRLIGDQLGLGTPARFTAPGGNVWFVFDDHRFKPAHVAYLGCLIANFSDIPPGAQLPTRDVLDDAGNVVGSEVDDDETRRMAKAFCEGAGRTNPLVLPQDIRFADDDTNPWQSILDAQGTPAQVRMGSGVPATWTVVNSE